MYYVVECIMWLNVWCGWMYDVVECMMWLNVWYGWMYGSEIRVLSIPLGLNPDLDSVYFFCSFFGLFINKKSELVGSKMFSKKKKFLVYFITCFLFYLIFKYLNLNYFLLFGFRTHLVLRREVMILWWFILLPR